MCGVHQFKPCNNHFSLVNKKTLRIGRFEAQGLQTYSMHNFHSIDMPTNGETYMCVLSAPTMHLAMQHAYFIHQHSVECLR